MLADVCWIDVRYNFGYTPYMKTAISIPDSLYNAAEGFAQRMGVSRSELYQVAVREYLRRHRYSAVTEALDEVYGPGGEDSQVDPHLERLQLDALESTDW